MILGVAILWSVTNSLDIYKTKMSWDSVMAAVSFLCLPIGSLTKGGAMPFHSWVPDFSARSHKFIGIFSGMAGQTSGHIPACCNMQPSFRLKFSYVVFAFVFGAMTVISAVSMALVQHDLKLLSFIHSVSQAGYMILGIATGTPLGLAAGIFHMLNNTVYKSGLFSVPVQLSTGREKPICTPRRAV